MMKKIRKVLCELKKGELREFEEEILDEARRSRFICRKCIRVAADKDLLCKPRKLEAGINN